MCAFLHLFSIQLTSPFHPHAIFQRQDLNFRCRTHDGVMEMTATRHPPRPNGGRVMTALRHAGRTLRYVNDELSRASDAMIRSARFPQPPPEASAGAGGTSAPAQKPAVPDRSSATATSTASHTGKAA